MFNRKAYMKVYKKKYYKKYRKQLIAQSVGWQKKNWLKHIWFCMKDRCYNPKCRAYENYGGRGIEVRYKSFEEFKEDIGQRPSSLYSIDRINNDGHYAPGNCRWATDKQQMNNRRCSK